MDNVVEDLKDSKKRTIEDVDKCDSENTKILKKPDLDNSNKEEKPEEKNEKVDDADTNHNDDTVKTQAASKFVFGSTTGFGNMGGFKMFSNRNNIFSESIKDEPNVTKDSAKTIGKELNEGAENEKNVEENEKAKEKEKEKEKENGDVNNQADTTKKPSTPVFGSGSSFGNAFQEAIKKKSIFDEIKKEEITKDEKVNSDSTDKDVYKKVHLEKQDIKSGEENENTVLQIKAKLYHMELSKISEGWKERGFGMIKVNEFTTNPADNYTSRLIMRQNGNLKLILNLPIVKGFNALKGMPSSLTQDKFIRLQVLEAGKPVQYAIKVGQAEDSQKLFDTIQKYIPK